MTRERSQSELVQDVAWRLFEGSTRPSRAETRALLDAYFEAQRALAKLRVEAQRFANDAAAQRWVIELLTNELDQKQKGHG